MGRRVDNLPLSESGDVFPPCDHNRCQMVPRHVTGHENDWLLFSHSLRRPRLGLSFFQFGLPRLCGPCFSFGKFFSCSILPKRLSLFVLFRSCVSCLLSCSRCMFALHSIGIAYRSTQCNYHLTYPDLSVFFSSSRWGQVRRTLSRVLSSAILGAMTLRGYQCHPLLSLKGVQSLFSNGKEVFLPRFETSSLSFQDPRTTSELAGIRTSARCRSGIHLPAAALFFVRVPFHNVVWYVYGQPQDGNESREVRDQIND